MDAGGACAFLASAAVDDGWISRVNAVGSAAIRRAHLNVLFLWRRVPAQNEVFLAERFKALGFVRSSRRGKKPTSVTISPKWLPGWLRTGNLSVREGRQALISDIYPIVPPPSAQANRG